MSNLRLQDTHVFLGQASKVKMVKMVKGLVPLEVLCHIEPPFGRLQHPWIFAGKFCQACSTRPASESSVLRNLDAHGLVISQTVPAYVAAASAAALKVSILELMREQQLEFKTHVANALVPSHWSVADWIPVLHVSIAAPVQASTSPAAAVVVAFASAGDPTVVSSSSPPQPCKVPTMHIAIANTRIDFIDILMAANEQTQIAANFQLMIDV
eukprot:s4376_g4.t1